MSRYGNAAFFVLLGQSNAVGHEVPMKDEDKISTPMKNVFGLSREKNQSFESKNLFWSGYTSFGMNLGETQDNTYSVANCLASLWQKEIDGGNKHNLPDLYIIHIAVGAQGVSKGYMWNPEYEKKLVPGELGKADIALFDLAKHVFSLLKKEAGNIDKNRFVVHWRGGEEDMCVSKELLSPNLFVCYNRIFEEFYAALGKKVPTVLHQIVCKDRCFDLDPSGKKFENMNFINGVFKDLCTRHKNIKIFDAKNAPQYVPNKKGNGIFKEDNVHFTPEVNFWVAECILKNFINGRFDQCNIF